MIASGRNRNTRRAASSASTRLRERANVLFFLFLRPATNDQCGFGFRGGNHQRSGACLIHGTET